MQNLEIDQTIKFKNGTEIITGSVKSISENFIESIDNSVSVQMLESEIKISPWDILYINDKTVPPIIIPSRNEAWYQLLKSLFSNPMYKEIFDLSNQDVSTITQPMDLCFILERLKSGWYRSTLSLQIDFLIFLENVEKVRNIINIQKSKQLFEEVNKLVHFNYDN